jgi:hypothetical protein
MAFVIDEYGEVMGLITLQDLIESITGEFSTNDPEESWAIKREDGSWLFDGHIPIPEFKDSLELDSVPEEDLGRYHTLSGLMMLLSGKMVPASRAGAPGRERVTTPRKPGLTTAMMTAGWQQTDFRGTARVMLEQLSQRLAAAALTAKDAATVSHLKDCRKEIEMILDPKKG